jgi:hypothetical protein
MVTFPPKRSSCNLSLRGVLSQMEVYLVSLECLEWRMHGGILVGPVQIVMECRPGKGEAGLVTHVVGVDIVTVQNSGTRSLRDIPARRMHSFLTVPQTRLETKFQAREVKTVPQAQKLDKVEPQERCKGWVIGGSSFVKHQETFRDRIVVILYSPFQAIIHLHFNLLERMRMPRPLNGVSVVDAMHSEHARTYSILVFEGISEVNMSEVTTKTADISISIRSRLKRHL